MNLPREPRSGENVKATTIAQLIRYVRSLTPLAPGVSRTAAGWTLRPTAVVRRGAAVAVAPFTVTDASDGSLKVAVAVGRIHALGQAPGNVPTIGTTPLDNDPAPTLAVSTSGAVYAKAAWTDSGGYDFDIVFLTSMPAEEADGDSWTSYLNLADVEVTGGEISLISQNFAVNLGVGNYGLANCWWSM